MRKGYLNFSIQGMMQTTHREKELRVGKSYEYFQASGLSNPMYLLPGRIF